MRYAGDLFRAFGENLREQKLASNRTTPIGAGGYGVVYESDTPGNVIKQTIAPDDSYYKDAPGENLMEAEANLQAIAAELGIAPRVAGLETFRGGIGNRIEMEDIRKNFESHGHPEVAGFPQGMDAVRVNQQLGQLALKNVRLEDRHNNNVMYNKMTGRPMQLDFGIAGKFNNDSEKAAYLSHVTAEGFEAAGIPEMGHILRATVMDYLEGGDVAEGLDIAKQGFSRLQKIKAPLEGAERYKPNAATPGYAIEDFIPG